MSDDIKNPELLQLQEEVNNLRQTLTELTVSHNKMYEYLKDKSTQGETKNKEVIKNRTLKDFINEKENKK